MMIQEVEQRGRDLIPEKGPKKNPFDVRSCRFCLVSSLITPPSPPNSDV